MHYPRPALAALALAVTLSLAALPATAAQSSVVARQTAVQMAAGEYFFRVADARIPADVTPPLHAHQGGFFYGLEGGSAVVIGGRRVGLDGNAAPWVSTKEQHVHARTSGAPARFLGLHAPPVAVRDAPAPPPDGVQVRLFDSAASFQLTTDGPRDWLLAEMTLGPGENAGSPVADAPTGVKLLEGQVSVGGRPLPMDAVTALPPGAGTTTANTGPGPARLLALSIVTPSAVPAQLPRTGGPVLPLGAIAIVAAGLGAMLRLGRRRD